MERMNMSDGTNARKFLKVERKKTENTLKLAKTGGLK
jgi:hypothetical protein